MKSLLTENQPAHVAIEAIHSLFGEDLDYAIRNLIDPLAESPSQSMSEAWKIAEKHNGEGFHKFNLHCDAGVWNAEFSGLFRSGYCVSPQEAMLQALLVELHGIVYDLGNPNRWVVWKP